MRAARSNRPPTSPSRSPLRRSAGSPDPQCHRWSGYRGRLHWPRPSSAARSTGSYPPCRRSLPRAVRMSWCRPWLECRRPTTAWFSPPHHRALTADSGNRRHCRIASRHVAGRSDCRTHLSGQTGALLAKDAAGAARDLTWIIEPGLAAGPIRETQLSLGVARPWCVSRCRQCPPDPKSDPRRASAAGSGPVPRPQR